MFSGRFKGVSRLFQGCFMIFKGVSRVFQGSFKKTLKVFETVLPLCLFSYDWKQASPNISSFTEPMFVSGWLRGGLKKSVMLHDTHRSFPSRRRACLVMKYSIVTGISRQIL